MIDYKEEWLFGLLFKNRGSLTFRALLWAVPSALACLLLVLSNDFMPELMPNIGLREKWHGPFWSATTASLAMLVGFRTSHAWNRFWEGTSLLHMMRGEWFDSVSSCVTFSRAAMASNPEAVENFRHTLVRLMSLCHGSALEEISADSFMCETLDSLGLDTSTLKHIKACKNDYKFNRVEVLLHMIQTTVTKAMEDGVLKVPPPILSRVYQTLSRGFVHLLNAKKIADTRFPFPWAQLLTILLVLHSLMTPFVFAMVIGSKFWATLITFISTFALFYLDLVAIELENPFGTDANDLPLQYFQEEMNSCLVMLIQVDVDLVPCCDMDRAELDFRRLMDQLGKRSSHVGSYMAKVKSDGSVISKKSTKRISDFVSDSVTFGQQTSAGAAGLSSMDSFEVTSVATGSTDYRQKARENQAMENARQNALAVDPAVALIVSPVIAEKEEVIPKEDSIVSVKRHIPTDQSPVTNNSAAAQAPRLNDPASLLDSGWTEKQVAPMPVFDSAAVRQREITQVHRPAPPDVVCDAVGRGIFPLCCRMEDVRADACRVSTLLMTPRAAPLRCGSKDGRTAEQLQR